VKLWGRSRIQRDEPTARYGLRRVLSVLECILVAFWSPEGDRRAALAVTQDSLVARPATG
jgi:hypothetical protein